MWVLDSDDDIEIVEELNRMPDRAAAIIATGFLERVLERTLRLHFNDDKITQEKFFRGLGPLSSLSAKIDLAYLMNFYDKQWHKCLHSIRKVRNEFSHDPHPLNFDSKEIRKAGGSLIHPKQVATNFIAKMSHYDNPNNPGVAQVKNVVSQLLEADDSFRSRFLGSVQLSMFVIRLQGTDVPGHSGKISFWDNATIRARRPFGQILRSWFDKS
jgi:hypothetical protein